MHSRSTFRPVAVVSLLLLACLECFAQTGQITGQVIDRTGASVPEAGVTITNLATGVSSRATTNAEGYYTVAFLAPGSYTVAVTKTGFKTATRSPVKVDVSQIARIDFGLVVGAQAEEVRVAAAAPLLQSESAAVGQVIGQSAVVDLPLNGRNFTQLTTLTPGASRGAVTGFVKGSTVVANGMRTSNTVFVVNGVNTTDQDFEGTSILPPPDAIQEFKVQTNNLEAQYGLGGTLINVELKSGTNALHGSVYEFLRNDRLDARNFFALGKEELRQNQLGVTLGGPVKRDRTFFFGDYEGTRIRNGQTFNLVVPSAAMRTGDFSASKPIVDPFTGKPFPNQRILPEQFSRQSAFFLRFFPLPNTPEGTFVRTATGANDSDQFDVRIDHQIRASDSVHVTYLFLQASIFVPGQFPDNGAVTTGLRHQSAGLSETHIFSPNVVNEFDLGYLRLRSFGAQQGLGANLTVQSGIGGFEVTSQTYPGFPALTPSGFASLTDNPFQPLRFRENNYNLKDTVTVTKGKHTLQTGIQTTWHSNFTTNSARSRGEFTFTGTYTGNSFADYLLGIPFQGARSFPRDLFGYYTSELESFVQDGWKITPRLTMNLGLRYSLFHQPTALHNVLSSVDPVANRITVASDSGGRISENAQQVAPLVFPLFSNLIVPSSQVGLDHSLRRLDTKDFAPRVGLAWQPGGHFVVRAGYGILYTLSQGVQFEGTVAGANLPFFADQLGIFNTTPVPTKTLANFFPPISPEAFSLPPLTFFQLDPQAPTPYFQQWNLAVQKLIGGVLSAEGAYVGSKGTHLVLSRPVNVPLPGPGPIQGRRLNPAFSAGSLIQETDNSSYNAFQGKLEARSWRGLDLLATFTWSKALDTQPGDFQVSPIQDPNDIRAERGMNAQPAARFTLSAVYQLPFLRRRSGMAARLLSGWELTSILTSQSGSAFTPIISTDPANTGTSMRPNRIKKGSLPHPTISRYFDLTAFQVPAPFSFGNSGVNILRGPGRTDWDFGLFKNFGGLEKIHLQLRAEFFNFTNTAHFANPVANIQSPAAGKILSADSPRQIQLALKLIF